MDHQNPVLRERACTLLGLSITEIILGCLSIFGTFGRYIFGFLFSPVHLVLGLLDLATGILLLATGGYGTALSQRDRRMTASSKSFRSLASLNIGLSVIYSLYVLLYLILLILLWIEPILAFRGMLGIGWLGKRDTDKGMANIVIPIFSTITVPLLVFLLLVTVAELVVAAIAAKTSRKLSATAAVNMERGGGVTFTVQPSAPAAYTEQPLLGTCEKAAPRYT